MNSPLLPLTFAIVTTLGSAQCLQAGLVTNTLDQGSGSLRAAIVAASNGETITFAQELNGATITLTTGELSITGLQLNIDASGLPSGIRISGNNSSRIFSITNNANVSLNSLDLFNGNSLNGNGGGIYATQSQLNCVNSTVRNCVSSSEGGGIYASGVSGTIDRCSLLGNDCVGFGGGIQFFGALTQILENTVISGNRAGAGGGIAIISASPTIINCTIQGNSGTGVQLEFSSTPNLRNTIVWGNRSGGGSIASQQIRNGSTANVDYCLVEGAFSTLHNLDGTLSTNNPKFIKPANPTDSSTPPTSTSDLRVFTNSPVLNVGDNSSNSTSLDRDGKARIQNGTIDLGAFETGYVTFAFLHPSLSPTGDSNGNGLSNFLEYATGIDPSAPDDPSVRPAFSTSGGFNFLTSSERSNAADTQGFWQSSTSLASNSWQQMVLGINYTVQSTSYPTPSRQQTVLKLLDGGTRRFYRQGFTNEN